MRNEARSFFAAASASGSLFIEPFFLRKSYGKKWQRHAESTMSSAELVIVYDVEACSVSENAAWEIQRAKELKKKIVNISREDINSKNYAELVSAYEFSMEFENCFERMGEDKENLMEMYKIMVNSSESLIQRRQITNGFFITTIGAIIGAVGFVLKEKIVSDNGVLLLLLPVFSGLLMCRSWGNLLENYGKLNAGKFKVINRIEKELPARIFSAEWVALGKGLRKNKYRSFTTTEKNVPNLFALLLAAIMALIVFSVNWKVLMGDLCLALAPVLGVLRFGGVCLGV